MLKEMDCAALQGMFETHIFGVAQDEDRSSWKNQNWPVLDASVSEDQGLMWIETEVPTPSLVANTTWIRTSRGVTQLTVNHQSSHQRLKERTVFL